MKTAWGRIIIDVAMYMLLLILPWWLSVVILFGLTIYLSFYLEVVFFGFLFDTLYGYGHIGIISALVLLLVVMFVRTRIRT